MPPLLRKRKSDRNTKSLAPPSNVLEKPPFSEHVASTSDQATDRRSGWGIPPPKDVATSEWGFPRPPNAPATEEAKPTDKRHPSLFGNLSGTIRKRTQNTESTDAEATEAEKKLEKPPLPQRIDSLFRRPSRGVKSEESKEATEATEAKKKLEIPPLPQRIGRLFRRPSRGV